MDWGIVASVVVALALFVAGLMVICIPACLVMMRTMKKRMRTGKMPGCPMPCGQTPEGSGSKMAQCASEIQ